MASRPVFNRPSPKHHIDQIDFAVDEIFKASQSAIDHFNDESPDPNYITIQELYSKFFEISDASIAEALKSANTALPKVLLPKVYEEFNRACTHMAAEYAEQKQIVKELNAHVSSLLAKLGDASIEHSKLLKVLDQSCLPE